MNIAFTVCSNNYLAQAKTLADSFLKYNQETKFVIGLIDRRSDLIDYASFKDFTLIDVESIFIEGFNDLIYKYNIVELNALVRPYYFKYLFDTYKDAENILYIDPDIMVFNSFNNIIQLFTDYDILLTPHALKPIPLDGLQPDELWFLNYGIYNFGFLGVKRSLNSFSFLQWLSDRLRKFCFIRTSDGMFVDQIWGNLIPVFFKAVKIIESPEINVAYWNLHERHLTSSQENFFFINDSLPLLFYHFSNYKPEQSGFVAICQNRITFENTPLLKKMFDIYKEELITNGYSYYKNISCYFNDIRINRIKKSRSIPNKLSRFYLKHFTR
jgi:hypothetical protein